MFNGRDTEYSAKVIENDGFWGNIAVADFQRQRAIPLQIPSELTETALIYAMHSVIAELTSVEESYHSQGIFSAADAGKIKTNGKSNIKILFEKAVFARAKSELLPEFATLSARELHEKRDIVSESKELLAECVMAIRLLKGKKRGSVHLI